MRVEESKREKSSLGAAAVKDVSVNLTTRNDTLIEAMLIFHCEGEEACVGLFPQYGRGVIIKKLVETCKQLKPGLFDLDITMAELREELLKVNKLELSKTQIVDVAPLATLVNLLRERNSNYVLCETRSLRCTNFAAFKSPPHRDIMSINQVLKLVYLKLVYLINK